MLYYYVSTLMLIKRVLSVTVQMLLHYFYYHLYDTPALMQPTA